MSMVMSVVLMSMVVHSDVSSGGDVSDDVSSVDVSGGGGRRLSVCGGTSQLYRSTPLATSLYRVGTGGRGSTLMARELPGVVLGDAAQESVTVDSPNNSHQSMFNT